jgi:formylglycine-generating enzyme required for sulfatase activity
MMKKTLSVFLVCLLYLLSPTQSAALEEDRKAGECMTLTINDVEYAFRWCPAGTFMMGSPLGETGRDDDETLHRVTLSKGFWMLETQVTQGMWTSVMGNNPSKFKGTKLPVERVFWNDCQKYIEKLNGLKVAPAGFKFALPTEAQWEYACRAGTTTAYHFGNTLTKEQANFGDMMAGKTSEVGSYPANAWGLYDMHGNVWEWCLDWQSDDYPSGAVTDPIGSPHGSYRVVRGGSWGGKAEYCRSANRGGDNPANRSNIQGLRLCLVSE